MNSEPVFGTPADRADQIFRSLSGRPPVWFGAAPGRVNLIGEHTDYNDGFALPMAIDRYTAVAAGPSADGRTTIYSEQFSQSVELAGTAAGETTSSPWTSYVSGVLRCFESRGYKIPPMNLVVCSDVPPGGGVSSSAALTVATAFMMQQAMGSGLDGMEIAHLCQQAEHRFAGVPCGVMDQISSVFGQAGNLMLLDCRSLEIRQVSLPTDDVSILVINSNVRHSLADGEYRARREQCEQATRALGISALRDIQMEELDAARDKMPDPAFRRARHVVSEILRTVQAATLVSNHDWKAVGQLMYASHDSLRDDYEVTCHETDLLVDLARSTGLDGGVFGSRMTGGGFGGCIVSLVQRDHAARIGQVLKDRYFEQTGIVADWFVTEPADGAMAMESRGWS